MVQKSILYGRRAKILMVRAGLFTAVLALAILGSSCAGLVRTKDYSIPKLITPLADSQYDDLLKQLKPFTDLQGLLSSPVYIRFLDNVSSQRYFEANSILILQRPDKIRLIIQTPGISSKIADMVSEENKFKVAIFYGEYKRFLVGANNADYSAWVAKIGDKGKTALASARPFHFTEAMMIRPLRTGEPGVAYTLEESLVEEDDTRTNAKKGARVLRSYYVISEIELPGLEQSKGPAKISRRFWFDRTESVRFARQQIFDARGQVATDVTYRSYTKLGTSEDLWPSVVLVSRPHDGYSAQLTFNNERFDVNPTNLTPGSFTLENTEKLPETDLDKPEAP